MLDQLSSLKFLGLKINKTNNERDATIISEDDSKIKALVLDTNEEIVVARETKKVIERNL